MFTEPRARFEAAKAGLEAGGGGGRARAERAAMLGRRQGDQAGNAFKSLEEVCQCGRGIGGSGHGN